MFCPHCGKPVDGGQKFCVYCGSPLPDGSAPAPAPAPQSARKAAKPAKKAGSKAVVVAVVSVALALVLALGAGAAVVTVSKSRSDARFQELRDQIAALDIPESDKDAKRLQSKWEELGLFAFSDRAELTERLEGVLEDAAAGAAELQTQADALAELRVRAGNARLADGEGGAYDTCAAAFDACDSALTERDSELAADAVATAAEAVAALEAETDARLEELAQQCRDLDMSWATDEDSASLQDALTRLETAIGSAGYADAAAAAGELERLRELYAEPARALSVAVQQVDVTDFPKVKLYASLSDPATGEVPAGLDPMLFFINKRDANGDFIRQTVTYVTQLNGQEALSVDIVADVSGSMSGEPLREAKNVMKSFINSVQFSAGDQVEITAFSTGVFLVEPFSTSASDLTSKIDGLATDNMTSLYDALCTAVTRVASQSGARCVIAFTDGLDNYSKSTPADVIDLACRYNVPVFIIGLGYDLDAELYDIVDATGGKCYMNYTVSDMKQVYDDIYRMEKELYLVEYEDSTGAAATDESEVELIYRSSEYGGQADYTFTPKVLLSVDDSALYLTGPEATVEGYLKGFDDAMTMMDYSYIAPYIKDGSGIAESQKKYVLRGISEELDSYEIVSVDYTSADSCVVTTRETFYIQIGDKPLKFLTQSCQYVVVREGGQWYMTDFAAPVKTLLSIRNS